MYSSSATDVTEPSRPTTANSDAPAPAAYICQPNRAGRGLVSCHDGTRIWTTRKPTAHGGHRRMVVLLPQARRSRRSAFAGCPRGPRGRQVDGDRRRAGPDRGGDLRTSRRVARRAGAPADRALRRHRRAHAEHPLRRRGQPTVVFVSGRTAPGYVWTPTQRGVSAFTRACWYDRADLGWSDPGPDPAWGDQAARDLHQLVQNAGTRPAARSRGHSFGGYVIRLYHHAYPGEVSGMVFVDAALEDAGRIRGMPHRERPPIPRSMIRAFPWSSAGSG